MIPRMPIQIAQMIDHKVLITANSEVIHSDPIHHLYPQQPSSDSPIGASKKIHSNPSNTKENEMTDTIDQLLKEVIAISDYHRSAADLYHNLITLLKTVDQEVELDRFKGLHAATLNFCAAIINYINLTQPPRPEIMQPPGTAYNVI